jgi:hypothetical protein
MIIILSWPDQEESEHPEGPMFRYRKRLDSVQTVQVRIVLSAIDLRPRLAVLRPFDHPILQMSAIRTGMERPDRMVCQCHFHRLEIEVNPLIGTIPGIVNGIGAEIRNILRITISPILVHKCSDVHHTSIMNISSKFRCQICNNP